jgi:hypothetical protein
VMLFVANAKNVLFPYWFTHQLFPFLVRIIFRYFNKKYKITYICYLFSRSIPRSVQTRPFRFRQRPLSSLFISDPSFPFQFHVFLRTLFLSHSFLRHYQVSVPVLTRRVPDELFTDRLSPPPAEYQSWILNSKPLLSRSPYLDYYSFN